MPARSKTPPTKTGRFIAFQGPHEAVDAARAALRDLGFVPVDPDTGRRLDFRAPILGWSHIFAGLRVLIGIEYEDGDDASADSIPWREAFPPLSEAERPGRMLRAARTKEDLTQRQLSALTGIPQHHLSEMEHGKRTIGKERAKKLAEALQIDYRMFL